jgi:O-antigen/teichoic acid export membrane protein
MFKDKIKSFASDTLSYGVFQMLGRLFTFLLTPLYSNYLSPTDNGVIAYMFSLLVVAQFVYIFGMEASFLRFFSQTDEEYNKKVYSCAFLIILFLGLIITLLLIVFSVPLSAVIIGKEFTNSVYIFQVVALIPFLDSILAIPYSRLRMQHKVREFALTRFLFIVLFVILCSYFLIFTSLGLLGVFLAQLISTSICLLYFLSDIIKSLDLNIDYRLLKEMLLFGLPTLPSNLSAIALQVADRPIMKLFVNNSDIGIYQINAKLAVPMLMFVSVFDYAWKPFFLSHFNDEDARPTFSRILTYYIFVGAVLLLLVSFFIDYIVRIPLWNGKTFINSDYWAGLNIVSVIMLGYLINGITTNFAAVFHIDKKTKYIPVAIGASAVISVALNFILIPMIGTIGAAISLVVGYTIGMIITKALQSKVSYKINYEWKRIFIIIISSLIVFVIGNYLSIQLDFTIAFIIKVALILVYAILLKLFGFFTKGEITQIRKILGRK